MSKNFEDCPLDEDEIEKQSNKIRTALSTIINDSSLSLKDAFESQRILSKKIRDLEILLKSLLNLPDSTDFHFVLNNLQHYKQRLTTVMMKLNALELRFQALELKVQKKN